MIKSKKLVKKFYRLNQYIQTLEVRLIDETGKQIGIFPIKEALEKAWTAKLDLVEVAPNAKPPVCKIIDFKKFKYLERKKQQEGKKKTKRVELKEVRLTPFIAENDFRFRIKRAQEFLKEGNKVKVSVRFHGRQMTKRDFGYSLIDKAKQALSAFSRVETESKFVGRQLEIILIPLKGGKNGSKKDENQKVNI